MSEASRSHFFYQAAGTNQFNADVLSVSMTIIPVRSSCAQLVERVNGAGLAPERRRPLLATLESACASYEQGKCEHAQNQLRVFQNKARAQLQKQSRGQSRVFELLHKCPAFAWPCAE